jgi:voltage-gated potassium channel Kch
MQKSRLKIKRLWAEIRWIVIGGAWLVSLGLGYLGFTLLSRQTGLSLPITERIYRALQLIGLESGTMDAERNWALEISRFLIPGLTAFTALQALSVLFREQAQWLQLWRFNGHCIVCGLGRKGSNFVSDLLANGQRLVVIDKRIDAISANDYRRRGVIVLTGDATDAETLLSARISKAKNLVCLLGEDQDNLRIAHLAFQLSKENQTDLTCILHLASQDLLGLVKRSELTLATSDPFILETFNTYQTAANQILQGDPGWISETETLPEHILIIGMGRLGQNLTLEAGYHWFTREINKKLAITILDKDAVDKTQNLIRQQPELMDAVDFQPINIDLSLAKSIDHVQGKIANLETISRVYLCISDSVLSLKTTLALRESAPFTHIPFFVRVEKTSGLGDLFTTPIMGLNNIGDLRLFDIHEETCSVELVIGGPHEVMARQLRENYLRSQYSAQAEALLALPWDEVSEAEKEANREQARRIYHLLASAGYHLSPRLHWNARNLVFKEHELNQMAQLEHQLWRHWRQSNGWQAGVRRDDHLQTNPDLVPWEDLKPAERRKNIEFIRTLPRLLADMGFEIVPSPQNE